MRSSKYCPSAFFPKIFIVNLILPKASDKSVLWDISHKKMAWTLGNAILVKGQRRVQKLDKQG